MPLPPATLVSGWRRLTAPCTLAQMRAPGAQARGVRHVCLAGREMLVLPVPASAHHASAAPAMHLLSMLRLLTACCACRARCARCVPRSYLEKLGYSREQPAPGSYGEADALINRLKAAMMSGMAQQVVLQ